MFEISKKFKSVAVYSSYAPGCYFSYKFLGVTVASDLVHCQEVLCSIQGVTRILVFREFCECLDFVAVVCFFKNSVAYLAQELEGRSG